MIRMLLYPTSTAATRWQTYPNLSLDWVSYLSRSEVHSWSTPYRRQVARILSSLRYIQQ